MKRAVVLFLVWGCASAHAATFTEFNVPGGGHKNGEGTYVNAIAADGSVTGNVIGRKDATSGFTYLDGQATVFNVPKGKETHAIDINSVTGVTGYYTGHDGHAHGFLRALNGAVTSFDPDESTGTQAISLNENGDVAGQFTAFGMQRGFLRTQSGEIDAFDGNAAVAGLGTFVTGINAPGTVAGFWFDDNFAMHGFLRAEDGTLTEVDIDGAGTSSLQGTQIESINNRGDITGFYTDSVQARHGFLRRNDGTVETFDAPGAQNTVVASINAHREVAGYFIDASNVAHGFVRRTSGKFKTFDAPAGALMPGRGTFVSDINDAGTIAGETFDDGFGVHGFTRTP